MDKPLFYRVEFLKSITNLDQRPEKDLPEISFIGRSNVGKSSLLNAIWNKKNMAKISSTPGKTRLINYFLVNDFFYFVDLPGYGYAKLPKKISNTWAKMIEDYLLNSERLRLICLLVDSRHKLVENDSQMIEWLKFNNLPYIIILTKTDKLPKSKLNPQIKYYRDLNPDHHVIPFSIKSEESKVTVSSFIYNILN